MLKRKITRNNILTILSIILIFSCILIKIYDLYKKEKVIQKEIEEINYIIETPKEKEEHKAENKIKKESKYSYEAVLEIPKINLRKGLVKSTKNFDSINYAVSIDEHSIYPNEIGNFILYAHSGNSSISYFDNLKYLDINDEIKIYYKEKWYFYNVLKKYEIDKNGMLSIYNDGISKYITLTTCSQENKNKQIVILGKQKD